MKTKNFSLAVIFFLILSFGFFYYFRSRNSENASAGVTPGNSTGQKSSSFFQSASQGLQNQRIKANTSDSSSRHSDSPSQKTQVSAADTSKSVPIECQEQWKDLVEKNLSTFFEEIRNQSRKLIPSCANSISSDPAKGMYSQLLQLCQKDFAALPKDHEDANLCKSWLMLFRAFQIEESTKSDREYSKMPLNLLINKAVGKFLQGNENNKEKPQDIRSLMEAIRDIEPSNPSTYRMGSLSEMILENDISARRWAEEGLRITPEDRDLRDLYYHSLSRTSEGDFLKFAETHPQDDLATYHRAALLWKNGQQALARNLIGELNQKYPNDQRYRGTRDNLNSSKVPENPFYIQVPMMSENW